MSSALIIGEFETEKQKQDLPEIPLAYVAEALRQSFRDTTYDADDAEMITACLIEQVG